MRSLVAVVWALAGVLIAGPAFGQQGSLGKVGLQREVQAISISLKTGWRGKKEVNETYGPPHGFVIIEHRVDLKKKEGNANLSVSVLPDKFTGITTEEVNTTYSKLADAAAKLQLVDYQAKLKVEQQDLLKRMEVKSVSSGVICVKASIEGSGELDFVVYAKIVNAATNVSCNEIERLHMENLKQLAANPKGCKLKDVLACEEAWVCPELGVCQAETPCNNAPAAPSNSPFPFMRITAMPASASVPPVPTFHPTSMPKVPVIPPSAPR